MKLRIKPDRWYHVVMGWALVILGASEFAIALYWGMAK